MLDNCYEVHVTQGSNSDYFGPALSNTVAVNHM